MEEPSNKICAEELFNSIIKAARGPYIEEPLDSDAIDKFCKELQILMDYHEGNW